MDIFIKMKLEVELIPQTCHGSNVRTLIPVKFWDKLRKESYEQAGGKCEICGGKGKRQGFQHDLECHEIWEYDVENKVQRLSGLIALCPMCHLCKHIGRALAMRKSKIAFDHMKKVNEISDEELALYLDKIFNDYKLITKLKFSLDLSILKEKIQIEEKYLEKAHKQRLDENEKPPKRTYRKKRKKKPLGVKRVVSRRPKKRK